MADLAPDLLPVLSRGKHRTPATGGCFMEFASWLAGERWSDHPRCTHPLLASLARMVNDGVSDHHRPRLARLVPSVVGLAGDDLHLDALVARRCAITALPVARPADRRALAVAVLTTERVLAGLDGRPERLVGEEAERVLAATPDATAWAHDLAGDEVPPARAFRRHAAPTTVRCAVEAILRAQLVDRDQVLHDLLADVIDDVGSWLEPDEDSVDAQRWVDGCRLLDATSVPA